MSEDENENRVINMRQVGKRLLVHYPDEIEIGRNKEWVLVARASSYKRGWINIKLFRYKVGKKNVWRLGYKKGQFARSNDFSLLNDHYSGILDWLGEMMKEYELKLKQERKEKQNG